MLPRCAEGWRGEGGAGRPAGAGSSRPLRARPLRAPAAGSHAKAWARAARGRGSGICRQTFAGWRSGIDVAGTGLCLPAGKRTRRRAGAAAKRGGERKNMSISWFGGFSLLSQTSQRRFCGEVLRGGGKKPIGDVCPWVRGPCSVTAPASEGWVRNSRMDVQVKASLTAGAFWGRCLHAHQQSIPAESLGADVEETCLFLRQGSKAGSVCAALAWNKNNFTCPLDS